MKRYPHGALVLLLASILCWSILSAPAHAALSDPALDASISEEQRPWAGMPWLIGIGLAGATIIVSLKNAKRTHLD